MILHVLPLLIFTTFAGFSAGAYAIDALCGKAQDAKQPNTRPWLFPLVCVLLLGIGLCGTLAHLGQPLRFLNGMANPASGISQESYWAIALGIVIVIDLVLSWKNKKTYRALRVIGGLVACGFMIVTGLAYYDCLGLAAWCTASTLPIFIVGDVVLGAALCVIFAGEAWQKGWLKAAIVATQVAWGITLIAHALYLCRIGLDATSLIVSAFICGPVLVSACVALAHFKKSPQVSNTIWTWLILLLSFGSVAIARYAFFAMGVGA